jgi:hypothetical protein
MARDISPEEARQEKIDELTFYHYTKLRQKLQGGNTELADMIDDAISHQMDGSFWREVVTSAAHDHQLAIGFRFVRLVEKALQAQAEIEALKEVEQLERQRKHSQDEARIDRAVMDRAMSQ